MTHNEINHIKGIAHPQIKNLYFFSYMKLCLSICIILVRVLKKIDRLVCLLSNEMELDGTKMYKFKSRGAQYIYRPNKLSVPIIRDLYYQPFICISIYK